MKKGVKVLIAVAAFVIVSIAVVLLIVLPATLNNAAKLQTYDLGADKIPSLNSIVGDRKVTGVSSSAKTGGVQEKTYTYETQSLGEDWLAYHNALHEAGFLVTRSLNGNDFKGDIQYGINSADEGKAILIDLSWDNTRIAVQITKGVGEITPYD